MSISTRSTSRQKMHFYNQFFRVAIYASLAVSLINCGYPLLFDDARLGFEVNGEVEIIKSEELETSHLILFTAINAIESLVWIAALYQLWGVSNQVKEEQFFSEKMEKYFSRFAYWVFGVFVVDAILDPVVGGCAYYLHVISDWPDIDLLSVFDFDLLAASIFLITASRIISEAKQLKTEFDLTI